MARGARWALARGPRGPLGRGLLGPAHRVRCHPVLLAVLWGLRGYYGGYSPYAYAAPGVAYAEPPAVYTESPAYSTSAGTAPPPAVEREVVYPHGRYVLYGDGVSTPYRWVWVPNERP